MLLSLASVSSYRNVYCGNDRLQLQNKIHYSLEFLLNWVLPFSLCAYVLSTICPAYECALQKQLLFNCAVLETPYQRLACIKGKWLVKCALRRPPASLPPAR